MSHLDDDELVAFVDGTVEPDARARIEAHAAACESCRELLSMLGRDGVATIPGGGPTVLPEPKPGRYQLERLLGAGGMGMVFAARDPELARTVAVKLLRSDLDQDRLRGEAQAMAMVSHPNVVAVHDVGVAGDRVFIAMEYVEGETLAQWLTTPRTPREILAKFDEAGRGLAAVHALGLVHRDFKPENVMVGPGERVRVTDFGVATRTLSNSVLGTPYYMAPEQCLGENVDARADQFSFCVGLYAALFGVRPFAGETLDQLCAAALARQRTLPLEPSRVSKRVLTAVVRGLAPSPDERFPAMEALLVELAPPAPKRWPIVVAASALAIGAVSFALLHHPKGALVDFELPSVVAPTENPGPALAPSFVEPASQDRLGSKVLAATWCEPRKMAVVATVHGRVATIDPDGVVTTIASIPQTRFTSIAAAVHCRRNGDVIVAVPWGGAVISAAGVTMVKPPSQVMAATDVGTEILWLAPFAVWSWDGSAPPKQVRPTCGHPLALSPDGTKTACLEDGHVVVGEEVGPSGTEVAWTNDALYVTDKSVVTRWVLGGPRHVFATGSNPTPVGPWLATRDRDELEINWTGPGPTRELAPIELQTRSFDTGILARIGDHAVVTVDDGSVRVVELDRPAPPLTMNRHTATIAALAFQGDAVIAASQDGRIISHAAGARTLVGTTTERVSNASMLAGGKVFNSSTGVVVGSDVLVHSAIAKGITLDDGTVLVPPPLARETQVLAVSPDHTTVLVEAGGRAQLVQHGKPIVSVRLPKSPIVRLAVGPAIAISDASGQAFVVDTHGVTPLVWLPAPITALAASPTTPLVAVGAGETVVVYDLTAHRELARCNLDSSVTALAFSADGKHLAAAAASTAIATWTY